MLMEGVADAAAAVVAAAFCRRLPSERPACVTLYSVHRSLCCMGIGSATTCDKKPTTT